MSVDIQQQQPPPLSNEHNNSESQLDFTKWKQNIFYREALDNTVLYNAQLRRDRKERLPYIDGQTGVLQKDCYLWRNDWERMPGSLPGQIYSYPSHRWRLEPPELPPIQAPSSKASSEVAETTNGGIPVSTHVQSTETVATKRSSRLAGLKRDDSGGVSTRSTMESPISSELNDEESEKDLDFLEEYDSEEEKKQKKKRKMTTRSRTVTVPQKTTRDNEKPFACLSCNRRYKTQSSLKAHQTQYHAGELQTAAAVEKPLPPVVPTPQSITNTRVIDKLKDMAAPPVKKRNPYCDFCLGDDSINQKSQKPEKMVSCADCGRSGHPSCLQFSPSLAAVVLTYRWQCIECKSCSLCGKSDNDDQLLFCDDCDRGYHMYCLNPPMKEAPEGSWSCGMC